jgi:alcohol dehydrogenase
MYPRAGNVGMIRLIATGALDLSPEHITRFDLDHVNDAVTYAAAHGAAPSTDRTILTPRT